MGARPTVRDLLAIDGLGRAALVGGVAGLDRIVADVVVVGTDEVAADSAADLSKSVLVLDLASRVTELRAGHLVDLLLHVARRRGARAVIVHGAFTAPRATARLADRFQIPVLVPSGHGRATLLGQVMLTVHEPDVAQARDLTTLARRLSRGPADLASVLGAVAGSLRATVALCTARGVVAASGELRTAVAQIAAVRSPGAALTGGLNVAVQPMAEAGRTPPLWLAAERADGGPLWREQAPRALALAQGWVSASVVGERLHLEHQARLAAELLWELQESPAEVSDDLRERAERAAWPLTGWHTGIQVRSVTAGAIDATTLHELDERLAAAGISAPRLIPRADGASTWLTAANRADAPAASDLIGRLRAVFDTAGAADFVAGVGSPESGPAGIGRTLAQARTAALLAQADEAGGRVRSSAALGPARLLLDWRTADSSRQDARQILQPVLDADPVLLATLASYLDSAGVATMTARRLGVHRNTVRQRIARIQALLDADLSDPDTRLALQLAQRLL